MQRGAGPGRLVGREASLAARENSVMKIERRNFAVFLAVLFAAMVAAVLCVDVRVSSAAQGAAGNSVSIPSDAAIVAKLETNLDADTAKAGDSVSALTVRDLKQGHETILKKGSTISGHMVKVEPPVSGEPSMIAILFDTVTPKGGQPQTVNFVLGALSPAAGTQTDTLQDGRGMAQTHIKAAESGSKDVGANSELTAQSVGVRGMPGVSLASTEDGGKQYAMIRSNAGSVKVKAGSQVLLKVAK